MPLQILDRFKKSNFSKLNSRRAHRVRNIVKRNNTKKKQYLRAMSGGNPLIFTNESAKEIYTNLISKVKVVKEQIHDINKQWENYFEFGGRSLSIIPKERLLIALNEKDVTNTTTLLHVFAENASSDTTIKLFLKIDDTTIMNIGESINDDNPLICFFKKLKEEENDIEQENVGEHIHLLYKKYFQAFMHKNKHGETAANFLQQNNIKLLQNATEHHIAIYKDEIREIPSNIAQYEVEKKQIEESIKKQNAKIPEVQKNLATQEEYHSYLLGLNVK